MILASYHTQCLSIDLLEGKLGSYDIKQQLRLVVSFWDQLEKRLLLLFQSTSYTVAYSDCLNSFHCKLPLKPFLQPLELECELTLDYEIQVQLAAK